MANPEHLEILKQGVYIWNQWRKDNPNTKLVLSGAHLYGADLRGANLSRVNLSRANLERADLSGADLSGVDLSEAHLYGADFSGANLSGANLGGADLREANLERADLRNTKINFDTRITDKWRLVWQIVNTGAIGRNLSGADLSGANLSGANLERADLNGAHLNGARLSGVNLSRAHLERADLSEVNLHKADLSGANLSRATLVKTKLTEVNLTNCRIYGISAWDLNLTDTTQKDLIVTPEDQLTVTVDNLEVAQFVYLLLHNEKIGQVIDTITSKAVLILGRFTPERKAILDKLRDTLRAKNYVPIVFDFDKPTNEDFTGTIKTLAGMCHFVIADITNPKSSPLELHATVPDYMIPFIPIIQEKEEPFAMFVDLWIRHKEWVFEPLKYIGEKDLIASLEDDIIKPAEQRFAELTLRKAQVMMTRSTSHRGD